MVRNFPAPVKLIAKRRPGLFAVEQDGARTPGPSALEPWTGSCDVQEAGGYEQASAPSNLLGLAGLTSGDPHTASPLRAHALTQRTKMPTHRELDQNSAYF